MRVETTTSDSGPVPRSHSPRFGSRLSRFIRRFLLADQVAEPGRLLVLLGRGGGLPLLLQLAQLGLAAPPGAPLAQVDLPLLLVHDVGQVNGGRVVAELAFHGEPRAESGRSPVGRVESSRPAILSLSGVGPRRRASSTRPTKMPTVIPLPA